MSNTDKFVEHVLFERYDEAKEILFSLSMLEAATVWLESLTVDGIKPLLKRFEQDEDVRNRILFIFSSEESHWADVREVAFGASRTWQGYNYTGPAPEEDNAD